jgi:anti-sigma regulatory factor (Ser/Thr protein kinase)
VVDSVSEHRADDGYRHEAFLWQGDEQFLARTVPFVSEGVAAGQPVMAAMVPSRIELLRSALGDDASAVEFVDMTDLGANPARIIPAWQAFIDEHAETGQPLRGIGEPVWAGRGAPELAECQLHEALLNVAVDVDTPLWLLCPYDLGSLPGTVVDEALRSHPVVAEGPAPRGSATYGGGPHVATMFGSDLPPAGPEAWRRVFGRDQLAEVRADVRARAELAGLTPDRTDDLALAVHEVATNSVEHGGGLGELRLWDDERALVCEVRDSGLIEDPMVGRRLPPWDGDSGRGLWLANQLCDLVQVRSGDAGTTVRIHTWR